VVPGDHGCGGDQVLAAVVIWSLPASSFARGPGGIDRRPAQRCVETDDEELEGLCVFVARGRGTRTLAEPAGEAAVVGAPVASWSFPGGIGHGWPPGRRAGHPDPDLVAAGDPGSRPGLCTQYRVHCRIMEETQSQLSVRDARAHFAEVVSRAEGGTPTVITRNGRAVAAVVPIEDYNALEDAIDRYFAQQADRDLADNPDAPAYSMSEVVAAIFEEEPGKGVA
jgi:prevent-host-death family protein